MEQKFNDNHLYLPTLREFCEREGEEIACRKGDQLELEVASVRWFAFFSDGCFKYVNGDSGWGNHPGIDLTGFYQVLVYVDSTPAQGTVSIYPDTNLFAQDSSITITAYPYAGFQFVGWKLNNVIVSNSNPYIFNASAHETYYAVFTIDD